MRADLKRMEPDECHLSVLVVSLFIRRCRKRYECVNLHEVFRTYVRERIPHTTFSGEGLVLSSNLCRLRSPKTVYPSSTPFHALVVPTDTVALTRTFRSPRTFSFSHSLLGRAIRHVTGDPLRGEALYILTITTLVLGVLMAHYLGWALLQPTIQASDTTSWELTFWFAQVGSVVVLFLIGGIGFRPPVSATVDSEKQLLSLQQGSDELTLSLTEVDDVSIISARLFHLHYRHYAATRQFIGDLHDEVVILRTGHGPVIIAISDEDAGSLVELVGKRDELAVESTAS